MTEKHFIALVSAGLVLVHSTPALLSIPQAGNTTRSTVVTATTDQIANVDRGKTLDGEFYPTIRGPALIVPSLYYSKMTSQLMAISQYNFPNDQALKDELAAEGPYTTYEQFKVGYKSITDAGIIEIPQALDNSDEVFGEMRLGGKGHTLKLTHLFETNAPVQTPHCGVE
ncbi:hypothetical protein V7S43_006606 [Phytophthora oleae]|uniref:RxLR effector protein n=1 Tax=Phytophthora oleae TaxID=2107226 RepID=A0ABD3FNN6_9STRA